VGCRLLLTDLCAAQEGGEACMLLRPGSQAHPFSCPPPVLGLVCLVEPGVDFYPDSTLPDLREVLPPPGPLDLLMEPEAMRKN
jgi:hypothetical protein